jgi:type I site-specific restriction-modification system R (restriction) subunit
MLKEITWKDYWTIVLVLTAVYYIFILLLFYRRELAIIAKGKGNFKMSFKDESKVSLRNGNEMVSPTVRSPLREEEEANPSANIHSDDIDEILNDEDNNFHEINLIPYAHELADEIKQLVEKAKEKRYIKEELLFSIQKLIKAYNQLKGTSYQREINNLIISTCKTQCSLHLSADEVDTVWLN